MGKGSEKKLRVAEQDGAGNEKILRAKNHLIFAVFIIVLVYFKLHLFRVLCQKKGKKLESLVFVILLAAFFHFIQRKITINLKY